MTQPDHFQDSQLFRMKDQFVAAAETCNSLAQLWRKFPKFGIESIRHANEKFGLELEPEHHVFTGRQEGVAVPKPERKK